MEQCRAMNAYPTALAEPLRAMPKERGDHQHFSSIDRETRRPVQLSPALTYALQGLP